jgi:hypothetical protein
MQPIEFLIRCGVRDDHDDAGRYAELRRGVHRAAVVGAVNAGLHDDRAADAERP